MQRYVEGYAGKGRWLGLWFDPSTGSGFENKLTTLSLPKGRGGGVFASKTLTGYLSFHHGLSEKSSFSSSPPY